MVGLNIIIYGKFTGSISVVLSKLHVLFIKRGIILDQTFHIKL